MRASTPFPRRPLLLAGPLILGAGLAAAAGAQDRTVETSAGRLQVSTFATGFDHPWSIEFLPDGRLLVSERPGRLNLLDANGGGRLRVEGLPPIFARGQGGLLDIALAPDYAESGLIYFSFAEPGGPGASTAVARARLDDRAGRLANVEVIFRQEPKVDGGNHFGSRLAFAADGKLFVTLGERFKFEPAQDLGNHLGTVVRLNPDGSVPPDNPFVGQAGARPEIWSYGHRNVEGAAIDPSGGKLWVAEMGPSGGDELNIPAAGRNYGWPVVSWGRHYNGRDIPDPPTRPDFADAVRHWTPVISPSGMSFYTADALPGWRGSLLIAGLTSRGIVRLAIEGERVTGEERIALGSRIRDVRPGPDGAIYAAVDDGDAAILRLAPAR